MRVVVLYRPNTEQERAVLDFDHDFRKETGKQVELLDIDTVEGTALAEMYGTSYYPAVLAIADDGSMQQMWHNGQLPLINELTYYLDL